MQLSKTSKKVGKKTVVTWFAQALDDGFGVPAATFTAGGHTVHANASGKARLKVCREAQRRLRRPATRAPRSECPSGLP